LERHVVGACSPIRGPRQVKGPRARGDRARSIVVGDDVAEGPVDDVHVREDDPRSRSVRPVQHAAPAGGRATGKQEGKREQRETWVSGGHQDDLSTEGWSRFQWMPSAPRMRRVGTPSAMGSTPPGLRFVRCVTWMMRGWLMVGALAASTVPLG